jgi:hypothetical protein
MQFVELVQIDVSGFAGIVDTSPIIVGGEGSGADVTFQFGDVIATGSADGSEDNSFIIIYNAQVMDVPGNTGTSLGNQTELTNVASLSYDTLPRGHNDRIEQYYGQRRGTGSGPIEIVFHCDGRRRRCRDDHALTGK